VRQIASMLNLDIELDVEAGEVEVREDDIDKVNIFFHALEMAGIGYEDAIEYQEDDAEPAEDFEESVQPSSDISDEEVLSEIAILRKHISPTQHLAYQRAYRRKKAQAKIQGARYRKTARYKRLRVKGKIKNKVGLTATGRRMFHKV